MAGILPIDSQKLPPSVSAAAAEKEVLRLSNVPVVLEGLQMLDRLPHFLSFHGPEHTKSVLSAVIVLTLVARLSDEQREMCAIAAAFHDLGFIAAPSGQPELLYENELRGAESAGEAMARFNYPEDFVRAVQEMILDTALTLSIEGATFEQGPLRNSLSAYLLDADVHNFGTEAFLPNILRLFNERAAHKVQSLMDLSRIPAGIKFMEDTYTFASHHEWQTKSAEILFAQKKRENLEELRRIIDNRQ